MRHTPPAKVWQGVASVLLGKGALDGGAPMVLVGLLMHFGVALGWSTVLLAISQRFYRVRAVLDSEYGPLKVASVVGPIIWLVMSFVVIPTLAHRTPAITAYWVVQLIGHIVFVGLPMAWAIRER